MDTPRKYLSVLPGVAALILAIMAITLTMRPVHAAGNSIVVLVNASNPIDNLTVAELKQIFLSDRSKWDTGRPMAAVIVTAGAPERAAFLKIVCGMDNAGFDKYFLQASFTGKYATPPKEVSTAQGVQRIVANSPGAIGFVKAADFTAAAEVKAIKVDGLSASDPHYKLKM
jgi:ABC-type phosphate transport system substrate-binding protein